MQVESSGNDVVIHRGRGRSKEREHPLKIVKQLLRQHRPAKREGLPPFTGGAVGYCSYDMVRQLERIGEHAKSDLSLPDCCLMFFDRLLAFDHLRHQIHIIGNADISHESPRRAYDRAVADIHILERKLARPASLACHNQTSKYASGTVPEASTIHLIFR